MAANPTTLTELRNTQLATREHHLPNVQAGFGNLASFELAQRAAKLLASSQLVPEQYQGNLANCVVALEMAQRIGASALMVMQNLYIVHGRPAWSAQFVIACVNQCGRFSALRYEWQGTEGKDDWGCRAWAAEKDTGEKLYGPRVTIALARAEGWFDKKGSKWKTIPQLMLMYRAGAWFGRTYAPELTMGLQTAEEARDVIDIDPDGSYTVTSESLRQAGPTAPVQTIDGDTGEITGTAAATTTDSDAPTTTYAQLMDQMNKAANVDDLDGRASMIAAFPTNLQRELNEAYKARRAQLEG